MEKTDQNTFNYALQGSADQRQQTKNVRKTIMITVIAALILIAVIWIWKAIEIGNLNKQAASERQAIKALASAQLMQTHEMHLKLLAKPLIWALRTEMLQGNLSQVNLYLNDLVKEQGVQRIIIADSKGKIIASTNKKDEGQPFSTVGKEEKLKNDQTSVTRGDSSSLIMTSPIMGFNNRLGTLLIKYSVPQSVIK